MIKLEKDPHAAFALIIDGKTLTYTLEDDLKHQFLGLAVDCASVICCRVSPKQKALVGTFLIYYCDFMNSHLPFYTA
jgi:phospholipid-translocating ATPase